MLERGEKHDIWKIVNDDNKDFLKGSGDKHIFYRLKWINRPRVAMPLYVGNERKSHKVRTVGAEVLARLWIPVQTESSAASKASGSGVA